MVEYWSTKICYLVQSYYLWQLLNILCCLFLLSSENDSEFFSTQLFLVATASH